MKDIIKTRNIIRKKYKALKSGRIESETLLEDAFKSITKPLKELVEKTESNRHLKSELKEETPYKSKAIETPEKLFIYLLYIIYLFIKHYLLFIKHFTSIYFNNLIETSF